MSGGWRVYLSIQVSVAVFIAADMLVHHHGHWLTGPLLAANAGLALYFFMDAWKEMNR